jgi:glycosyl transferase family 87
VIGADHLTHGQAIWNNFPDDNSFGDTYGPFNYYAYVPFELVLPWSGSWDNLPAAHAAAIFFDLATVGGLFALGRRIRPGAEGTRLGVILGFAWAAYPFTDYALQSNSNDALVAALLVWALVLFASPIWRGVMLALSVATKFAPLPLVPLFAAGRTGLLTRSPEHPRLRSRVGPVALFTAVFALVIGLMLVLPAVDPGLGTFYDRTIKSQIDRTSPFSVWGQDHSLEWLQTAVKVFAIGLAVLVAFLPRRRSLPQVAALAAAVMIAVELTAEHWFYLYIPWFFGLAMAGLVASTRPSSSPTAAESSAGAPGIRGERVPASAR